MDQFRTCGAPECRRVILATMRTMKVDGEIVELPEVFPDHPYFRSQTHFRKRNRAIYGMFISEENITLAQVGAFWAISPERARQIIMRVARIIRRLEAGDTYGGYHCKRRQLE